MLKNTYISFIRLNLYSLLYKGYYFFRKFVNKLFYFNIFNSILDIDIYSNYYILFNFIENKNKKFYIYFSTYKDKTLSAFKSLKYIIKYNNYIIKRLYSNKNIIIKNKAFNNYRYNYNIS